MRLCRPRDVQQGAVTPQAFAPRPGEAYVSFHWLEYVQPMSTFPNAFDALRAFLVQSRFGDLAPQQNGRLVALRVGSLRFHVGRRRLTGLFCRHFPRVPEAHRLGIGKGISDPLFDPHSGVYAVPWSGAELMAVQQFLLSKVVHAEVGKKPSTTQTQRGVK